MRNKETRHSVTALWPLLWIFAGMMFVVGAGDEASSQQAVTRAEESDTRSQRSNSVDYHVWRIYPENRQGLTIVVVSVNPKHFNRSDMISLAAELNNEFANKKKLRIGLLDDADTARLFAQGRASYPTYERAERGRYYLDRDSCKEYVQFEVKKGRPRETVRFKCKR
jgi:hypothetical protein